MQESYISSFKKLSASVDIKGYFEKRRKAESVVAEGNQS